MKTKIALAAVLAAFGLFGILWAADHIDTPAVTGKPTDITDVYVFRAANENNLVFVMNTQGLLSPSATADAKFDENTLLEFNIDNNGDNVEDLVIQAYYDGDHMQIYGPVKPSQTGATSKLEGDVTVEVKVTEYGDSPETEEDNGVTVFAGPRDDPFFFDLDQFKKIIAGTATGFNDPGNDTFKGTNVMSVVVEVPKSMLGGSGTLNVWGEAKTKI